MEHHKNQNDESCTGLQSTDANDILYSSQPATKEQIELVLNSEEDDDDGRSEWRLFRMANGDMIFGVYPCGATYEKLENECSLK